MYEVGTTVFYMYHDLPAERLSLYYGTIEEALRRDACGIKEYEVNDYKFGRHIVKGYDIVAAYSLAGGWFYHDSHKPTTYEAIVIKWVKNHEWDIENFKEVTGIKDLFTLHAHDFIAYWINGNRYLDHIKKIDTDGIWVLNLSTKSFMCIKPKQVQYKIDKRDNIINNPHFDENYKETWRTECFNKPFDPTDKEKEYIHMDKKSIVDTVYNIVSQEIINDERRRKLNRIPEINHIEQNGDYTTAIWSDGSHTIIKLHEDEFYDAEKAYLWLIFKKLCFDNKSECDRILKIFEDKTVVKD